MRTLTLETDEVLELAAKDISDYLRAKPDAVVAMSAGRTMLSLWKHLPPDCLGQSRYFQVSEFVETPEEYSLKKMAEMHLLPISGLKPERCCWLDPEKPEACENSIRDAGGIDLAVLGIGVNAHIGFNEPATQFSSRTRVQKLTEKTRMQYAWLFGSPDAVPEKACTMGIRTLTEAKKIVVIALGEEKAEAVFKMLYGRNDSTVPAAFLQIPSEVTVYTDLQAGSKL